MNGNQAYCGDYFIMYVNIDSLCYIPETNKILYINYSWTITKKVKKKGKTHLLNPF